MLVYRCFASAMGHPGNYRKEKKARGSYLVETWNRASRMADTVRYATTWSDEHWISGQIV
jgi:hypothetical protein